MEAVFVEGHTDDIPISTSRHRSNWDLSADRAINTYNSLIKAEENLDYLESEPGKKLFGVSGYAEYRPVKSNRTPAGKKANRRIDLRFLIASPTLEEIKRLQEKIDKQQRERIGAP